MADTYGTAALQSLNRILQAQQQREKSDVQESLALMQFAQTKQSSDRQYLLQQEQLTQQKDKDTASLLLSLKASEQQKKQFDIANVGKSLELLQGQNQALKLKAAGNFLQESGLAALYNKFQDEEDGLTDAVDELADSSFFGEDIKMDRKIASDLVSATWSAYGEAKNPDAIINIGSKLYFLDQEDAVIKKNSYEEKLFTAFQKIGLLRKGEDNSSIINSFKTMRDALDNEISISKEVEQFVKGDYKIQEDFKFLDKSLLKLNLEKGVKIDDFSLPQTIDKTYSILPIDKQINVFSTEKKKKEALIQKNADAIKSLKDLEKAVIFYQSQGLKISEADLQQYTNREKTLDLLESNIKEGEEDLSKLNKLLNEFKKEQTIKRVERTDFLSQL